MAQTVQIVLVNPEIPQNTGSIARTCAATKTPLHLVGKLGFDISEKAVRRAGLDYWPWVPLQQHESYATYIESIKPKRVFALTKFATKPYYKVQFQDGDALVFGSETKGLGKAFLDAVPAEFQLSIPMDEPNVRSLNLSNAVSIVLYEARRQFAQS
jgi:tRNA (cytidine/uridine-2'-O-)-methyltransferase